MDRLRQDLRYALRTLRKSPGWTWAAAATLALGLGATTAVMSVFHDVVLRPLPYLEPDRIQVLKGRNTASGSLYQACSYPTYEIYRQTASAFESLEAWAHLTMTFQFESGAESLRGTLTSAGVFTTLGVKPALGRSFEPLDDLPESAAVVILSHGLWQRRFAGDPGILGETFWIEEEPYTVIGVMPAGFHFPDLRAQYWLPMRIAPRRETAHYLRILGRIKADRSLEEAGAQLAALRLDVPTGAPGKTIHNSLTIRSLKEEILGEDRAQLLIFLVAVASVLLVACLNVVNLLLSRAVSREREIAVRAALGAGRFRIVRQFVVESVLLSLLGGLAGLALAFGLLRVFFLSRRSAMPRGEELGLDPPAFAFAFVLALLVGFVVALMPAWRASRPDLRASLQEGARGSWGRGFGRLRHGAIVAQLALTLVLLTSSSLLFKSFLSLVEWESGFAAQNVLVADFELPGERYLPFERQKAFYDELTQRLERSPGVRTAAITSSHPFEWNAFGRIEVEGYVPGPNEKPSSREYYVTPNFFEALGMTLLAGRPLGEKDGAGEVVINEALARRYFPPGEAVGRRLRLGAEAKQWRTVVGVVSDIRQYSLGRETRPTTYIPLTTGEFPRASTLLLRTEIDPLRLAALVRQTVAEVDRNVPVYALRTLEDDLRTSLAVPRFRALLLGIFGATALLLAMVGLYGTMAYWVAQRTRELGVRMALGADAGRVVKQVVARGLALTLTGLGLGLFAVIPAAKILERYLFELEPYDPSSLLAALLGLITAGCLACWLPARRASRLDPVAALRGE